MNQQNSILVVPLLGGSLLLCCLLRGSDSADIKLASESAMQRSVQAATVQDGRSRALAARDDSWITTDHAS